MKADTGTAFYLIGAFLVGATIHSMLALVMNPVIGGVLVMAIAIPLSLYLLES